MDKRYTLEEIEQHWTENARTYGTSYAASWNDQYAIELEINTILQRLQDGEQIIDIGCANGYSTLRYAAEKQIRLKGVDYIPEMIELAKGQLQRMRQPLLVDDLLKNRPQPLKGSVEFEVGNIMKLAEPDNRYDKAIVVRVLINLETWENQAQALSECVRILKPGGTLLLSEAVLQGWQKMNTFRLEWGLEPVPMPPHNTYLDERLITDYMPKIGARVEEIVNFSSTYFVGTRVLKPLLAQASGQPELEKQTDIEWNRFFSMIPAFGDYGTQKLFVISKR